MARSRGSRSGGFGNRSGGFGGSPRQSSTLAARPPAPTRTAPPVQTPVAPPPPAAQAAPVSSGQPGLFGQMASTAAGVAVGSTIGHTLGAGITGLFSGGGNSNAVDNGQQQQQQPATLQAQQSSNSAGGAPCELDARNFTRCLDENSGELGPCDFYLQQLKACQEAARQY